MMITRFMRDDTSYTVDPFHRTLHIHPRYMPPGEEHTKLDCTLVQVLLYDDPITNEELILDKMKKLQEVIGDDGRIIRLSAHISQILHYEVNDDTHRRIIVMDNRRDEISLACINTAIIHEQLPLRGGDTDDESE